MRWQVEIMFKIWKSIFKIHAAKKVKIERFYCCLYGKLIAIVLGIDVFQVLKDEIYKKEKKEISEIIGLGMIKEFMPSIRKAIFNGPKSLEKVFGKIRSKFIQGGEKSRRKDKKTFFDILINISN